MQIFKSLDDRFKSLLKKHKKPLIVGLSCSAIVGWLDLLSIAFIYWTTDAIAEGKTTMLGYLCLAVVGLYLVKYWFSFGQTYYLSLGAQHVTADLRNMLFQKLHELPMAYFNRQRVGAIQSVLTNDVAVMQNGIGSLREFINSPISVVGGIIALFILSWKLAIVSLVALPPVALAIRYTAQRVRKAQLEVQHELAGMTSVMQESLSSVRVVKAFSAEEREKNRFANAVKRALDSNMKLVRRIARLKPLIELIGAVALAATMWIGGYLVASGDLKIAGLFAFGFTLDKIVRGSTGLGNVSQTYSAVSAANERIAKEVLDVQSDIPESDGAKVIENPQGCIEFKNVSFTYPDGTEALRNVSFIIEPGKSAALVGRSGAGKSTIADLLLRFYDPTEGMITFDGVDLKDLKIEWLRRQIGIVPQQTLLFAGTIRENIALGKPDATDEEIKNASMAAHAHEFIMAMPNNYETELGEKGVRLSGGEMQRVAIARALLMNPRLLILDEATSALDSVSERLVQKAIDEIMRERTTLLIAHRLNTAARTHQIIVLAKGKIVEKGTHTQLISSGGAYAGMYEAFSLGLTEGRLD